MHGYSMMDVLLRCIQSPVCQLKEDVTMIEAFVKIIFVLSSGAHSSPPTKKKEIQPKAMRQSYT